jgi:hypothetical protein
MARRYVFQSLSRVSELQGLENIVHVYPMMCLLVKNAAWKRVSNVEQVAINLFASMGSEILCQSVVRG